MVFMLSEGAVGAALVLLEHVAGDRSVARAAWTSLHLSNTFFLVAALTATAYWASIPPAPRVSEGGYPPAQPRRAGRRLSRWGLRPQTPGLRLPGTLLLIGAVALLLSGVSGAITALGDTLFTATSLARGIADDFSPTAHFLQQLRVLHPITATLTAVFLLYARAPIAAGRGADAEHFSRLLAGLVVAQLLIGVVNFALRAPIAMQLVHLFLADLVWVVFVLLGAAALGAQAPGRAEPSYDGTSHDGAASGPKPRPPAEASATDLRPS
jgi:cytochrome c oxidase assembly protein subunit 15